MRTNRLYVLALTVGLATTPALPVMAQQSGTYQGQDSTSPSQDRDDQNQSRPWSEDQNQQGQTRDHGTYTSGQGQSGQDRDSTSQSGQDRDRDRDQNGAWEGSDKNRSGKDRDDQNRADDQGWGKDSDNNHSRVSSSEDYTSSKFYKLGYQDGRHDRDMNSRRDHNRNFKNEDDRRAYEAGYNAAFGREH